MTELETNRLVKRIFNSQRGYFIAEISNNNMMKKLIKKIEENGIKPIIIKSNLLSIVIEDLEKNYGKDELLVFYNPTVNIRYKIREYYLNGGELKVLTLFSKQRMRTLFIPSENDYENCSFLNAAKELLISSK